MSETNATTVSGAFGDTLRIGGEVQEFLRKALEERLSRCTEKQREAHRLIYPNGVRGFQNHITAIDRCDRTLRKMETGISEYTGAGAIAARPPTTTEQP